MKKPRLFQLILIMLALTTIGSGSFYIVSLRHAASVHQAVSLQQIQVRSVELQVARLKAQLATTGTKTKDQTSVLPVMADEPGLLTFIDSAARLAHVHIQSSTFSDSANQNGPQSFTSSAGVGTIPAAVNTSLEVVGTKVALLNFVYQLEFGARPALFQNVMLSWGSSAASGQLSLQVSFPYGRGTGPR